MLLKYIRTDWCLRAVILPHIVCVGQSLESYHPRGSRVCIVRAARFGLKKELSKGEKSLLTRNVRADQNDSRSC